jgi:hypothetical protein
MSRRIFKIILNLCNTKVGSEAGDTFHVGTRCRNALRPVINTSPSSAQRGKIRLDYRF